MKRLVLIGAAAAALAAPGVASAHSRGVVVKVERAKHAVAVARAGHVARFKAQRVERLHVGQVIRFDANKGKADNIKVVGRANRTKIEGTVVSVSANSFTVNSGGVLFTFPLVGNTPAVGAKVEVEIEVDEADDEVEVVDALPATGEIEGRLTIGTGTITVANNKASLVIAVPAGVDLSRFRTGDFVEAKFAQDASGKVVLVKLERADDEHEDDDDDDGGDHDGDHHGGDHDGHGGHGHG